MPPVVPKFLFYLELNFKPLNDWIKKDMENLTTADLRNEVKEWFNQTTLTIEDKEQKAFTRESEI